MPPPVFRSESIRPDPVLPCAQCGATSATLGINRALALAIYRCPYGYQWTVEMAKRP